MKRITFFTGNRGEFGIQFPIIAELSKKYHIDIIFSGAHVLKKWNTYNNSISQLDNAGIIYHAHRIELSEEGNAYLDSLGEIYSATIDYFTKNDVDFAFVLGDRIESFGFALAAFYSRIPLFHLCGGDIVQVSHFDTHVRHSITKLANYHLVTNEFSKRTVLQLGEEDGRVVNIGNPSFDYERMGYLASRDELIKKYRVNPDDVIGILTFHPAVDKTAEENYADFQMVYDGCVASSIARLFVTYPNNDPGYDKIVDYLENEIVDKKVTVVKSLGTFNYLGIMNEFEAIIIGNSSSGLLETLYYQTPVLNIGNRQSGRIHGCNVEECEINNEQITNKLNSIVLNYNYLKKSYESERFRFGDGKAAIKVAHFLEKIEILDREEQLFKKFVVR